MKDDKISDMDNQDVAYFHTTAIEGLGKVSGLAHCITIAPTSKVEPGKVVQYKKLPSSLNENECTLVRTITANCFWFYHPNDFC